MAPAVLINGHQHGPVTPDGLVATLESFAERCGAREWSTLMVLFALLLVRRFGLAIGTFMFVYFLMALSDMPERHFGKSMGMSFGAAIVAFFIPGVKIGSPRRDEES